MPRTIRVASEPGAEADAQGRSIDDGTGARSVRSGAGSAIRRACARRWRRSGCGTTRIGGDPGVHAGGAGQIKRVRHLVSVTPVGK